MMCGQKLGRPMLYVVMLSTLLYGSTGAVMVPTAQSLGSSWTSMPVRAMPVVTNFNGGATLQRETSAGVGMAGLGPITTTPFDGNFINSTLFVASEPLKLGQVQWAVCEAVRHATNIGKNYAAVNHVRMPFETPGVMQTWDITGLQHGEHIELNLDGPFFRHCDDPGVKGSHSCGWGVALPTDRLSFSRTLAGISGFPSTVMITSDKKSAAVVASLFWCASGCADNGHIEIMAYPEGAEDTDFNVGGYIARASAAKARVQLRFAAVVSGSLDTSLAMLKEQFASDSAFDLTFSSACTSWEKRWNSAFDVQSLHFSGNLPLIESNDASVDRLYYWAALAMVALERPGLESPTLPFVISEGGSNSLRGDADMGGAGQFVWDFSFAAASYTLLDPKGTRKFVQFLMRYSNLTSVPVGIPQSWDPYPKNSSASPGEYCFDYVASFLMVQQYVVMTGDTAILEQTVPGTRVTGLEWLRAVAWAWKGFNRTNASAYLVDYGADKRLFLEAVPTYRWAIPGLQASNAGIMLSFARLLEFIDSKTHDTAHKEEASWLRGNASCIIRDLLQYQYRPGKGFFQMLQSGRFSNGTEVRAISDYIYVGLALDLLGRDPVSFPPEVREEMLSYFMRELLANGWVRAVSLQDPVMQNVDSMTPGVEDKLAFRSDWTGTGGYGGLAGAAVDASVGLEQGFQRSISILKNLSVMARMHEGTMPSQGVVVSTPPYVTHFLNDNDGLPVPDLPYAGNFPEWFDEGGSFPEWWPSSMRSIQNAEASIVDAVVRSVFGWRPDWSTWNVHSSARAAIDAALFLPSVSRAGFDGVLRNVRTPVGLIDLHAGEHGVSWKFSLGMTETYV